MSGIAEVMEQARAALASAIGKCPPCDYCAPLRSALAAIDDYKPAPMPEVVGRVADALSAAAMLLGDQCFVFLPGDIGEARLDAAYFRGLAENLRAAVPAPPPAPVDREALAAAARKAWLNTPIHCWEAVADAVLRLLQPPAEGPCARALRELEGLCSVWLAGSRWSETEEKELCRQLAQWRNAARSALAEQPGPGSFAALLAEERRMGEADDTCLRRLLTELREQRAADAEFEAAENEVEQWLQTEGIEAALQAKRDEEARRAAIVDVGAVREVASNLRSQATCTVLGEYGAVIPRELRRLVPVLPECLVADADRLDAALGGAGEGKTTPASALATYDTVRAELVAQVGECCQGSDPLCSGPMGCLVQEALRRRAIDAAEKEGQ